MLNNTRYSILGQADKHKHEELQNRDLLNRSDQRSSFQRRDEQIPPTILHIGQKCTTFNGQRHSRNLLHLTSLRPSFAHYIQWDNIQYDNMIKCIIMIQHANDDTCNSAENNFRFQTLHQMLISPILYPVWLFIWQWGIQCFCSPGHKCYIYGSCHGDQASYPLSSTVHTLK